MNIITFNNLVNWRLFAKLLLILSVFLFIAGTAEAKTVKRGIQATDLTIAWSIVGGSMTCLGSFTGTEYPSLSDNVNARWKVSHANSGSPLILVKAGSSVLANAGTYVFKCTDAVSGQSDTDSLIVKGCDTGETWDGSTCKVPSGEDGWIKATGCTINKGSSSCPAYTTWDTSGFIDPARPKIMLDDKEPPTAWTGYGPITPPGVYRNVTGKGSHFYILRNSKNAEIARATFDVSCETGSDWDTPSGTCKVTSSPSGNIQATSCVIPVNGTICSSTVTWSSLNFVSTPKIEHGSVFLSAAPNNPTGIPRNVNPDNKTFTLKDGATVIATGIADVTCAGASTWVGGKCSLGLPPTAPIISLTATPNSITLGDTFKMEGTTDQPLANCNAWASPVSGVWTGDWKFIFGSYWNLAPTVTATYYIKCTGANGQDSNTANVTVTVGGVAVNGSCGTNAKAYGFAETSYSGSFCSPGTASPASPAFPARGGSTAWQCLGSGGGTNAPCSASRGDAPPPTFTLSGCSIGEEANNCGGYASWDLQKGNSPYAVKNVTYTSYYIPSPASTSAGTLGLGYGSNEGNASAAGIATLVAWADAYCASPLFWHSTALPSARCKAIPKIVIDPSSSLIRKGKSAEIEVKVKATYPTECKVTGGNPSPDTFTLMGSVANPDHSQRVMTGPHQATQVVKIECYVPGFPDIPSSHAATTTRISVLPNYQEL